MASASLAVKYHSPILNLVIIRASRDTHKDVHAAVSLIDSIRIGEVESAIHFKVFHVGGTIQKCQKKAVAYAENLIFNAGEAQKERLHSAAREAERTIRNMDG